MGRFSLVVEKTDIRRSNVGAALIVSLLLQGVSAEKRRSNAAFSSQSFSSLSTLLPMPETAFGNGDAGFVTIGDYVFYQGEKPLRGFAAMRLTASKTSRAGKRVDEVDAQAMNALAGEAGWMRRGQRGHRTHRGIARQRNLSAGHMGMMSEAARMGGNERNRVKC
jgi:hypothetical protein